MRARKGTLNIQVVKHFPGGVVCLGINSILKVSKVYPKLISNYKVYFNMAITKSVKPQYLADSRLNNIFSVRKLLKSTFLDFFSCNY